MTQTNLWMLLIVLFSNDAYDRPRVACYDIEVEVVWSNQGI
jgi:hypothetical protein